ncbi:hypothetical protein M422DRAFT_258613 [Sphaerobolus stellatus SS14]|uniref:Uncharacterized protein n=1 Tax=Sphaerobolus stellatus (strain SS14) TaxID=990650 RepID=A0A0C9VB15_SPHS4|nr:hypothetical protein M422DRAFT_258613 [Sphaerobolus stellatus SS14]
MYLMQDYNIGKPGEHDRFVPLRTALKTALKTASKTQSIDHFEDTKVLTLRFASKTSEEGYKRWWASINDRHPARALGRMPVVDGPRIGRMPVVDGSPPALISLLGCF